MKKIIFITGLILFSIVGNLVAQNQKAKRTSIYVEYFKNRDDIKTIVATLKFKEKSYVPLAGEELSFYNINDTSRILVGKIITNERGRAVFAIEDDQELTRDSEGFIEFEAEYIGNKEYDQSSSSISFKEANIEISFFQKDEIKYIEVLAAETNNEDEIVPMEGASIIFYVEGTYSLLNIGEVETDENGKAKIEFPIDLPGDLSGELTIIAKILESEDYGTIEDMGVMNWGIPIEPIVEKKRGLGDTDAPLWMVYTLIILLSAVWFHYLYVIFMIIKIKLEEKKIKIRQFLEADVSE